VKNTSFNRIVPSLYALSGEIAKAGSEERFLALKWIEGSANKLVNENYNISHDSEGILSLVNNEEAGTSQLLITLGPVEWYPFESFSILSTLGLMKNMLPSENLFKELKFLMNWNPAVFQIISTNLKLPRFYFRRRC